MNIHGGDDACMNFRWLWNRWAFFFFFFFLFFPPSLSLFWCVNSAVKILMWSSTVSPRPVQGRFLCVFLSLFTTETYTDRAVYCKLLICGYFHLFCHWHFTCWLRFCILRWLVLRFSFLKEKPIQTPAVSHKFGKISWQATVWLQYF